MQTWARPPWAVPTQSYPGSQGVNPFAYWPQPVPFSQDTFRTPVTCSQSNSSSVLQNSELVSSFKEVLSDFKKSMSVDLATISSRISSLEVGHRVSLPTPCEEVSDLISMAPGSQEATFLSEDEHEEGEFLIRFLWLVGLSLLHLRMLVPLGNRRQRILLCLLKTSWGLEFTLSCEKLLMCPCLLLLDLRRLTLSLRLLVVWFRKNLILLVLFLNLIMLLLHFSLWITVFQWRLMTSLLRVLLFLGLVPVLFPVILRVKILKSMTLLSGKRPQFVISLFHNFLGPNQLMGFAFFSPCGLAP